MARVRIWRALPAPSTCSRVQAPVFSRRSWPRSESASGEIHLKKSGIFPIVHGIRTLAIDCGLAETSTAKRVEALVARGVLGEEFGRDVAGAMSYLMEVRLRSQLRAMKSGHREAEAIVRISELSTGDRDLLRDALRVVKRFREVIRTRYHLGLF